MAIELADKEKLTKEQKQAIGILSFGTFLEYFDLMLYIHMAVLLNDLFFSKTDAFSAQLLSAFSFCVTFVFRPIGALLIGWIGDTYGRKYTVILTTCTMSICCIAIASLPTYEQVGITASIAVTLCRVLQGMSSMGERVGAEIYLTEIIRPPKSYLSVGFVGGFCTTAGGIFALFIANHSLSNLLNWRVAFLFGALIAFLGIFARSKLRETPDFADAKKELHKLCDRLKIPKEKLKESLVYVQKINKKSAISYFLIQLACPVWVYLTFIHCSNILIDSFGYTVAQVIYHNLIMSFSEIVLVMILLYLVSFINPLKILKIKFLVASPLVLICPFLFNLVSDPMGIMLIQAFIISFAATEFPATPIFYKSYPVFKRFTGACISYAVARGLMYVISSFGIIYLIKYFGNLGLLFLLVPVIVGYGYGLFHFINLEKKRETYIDDTKIDLNLNLRKNVIS